MTRDRTMGDGGFTLVELVVCLGLLSLIATMVAQGLAVAAKAGAAIRAADRQNAIQTTRMHLRRAFERVELLPTLAPSQPALLGHTASLRFVARSDRRLERDDLVSVELGLEGAGASKRLVELRHALGGAKEAVEDQHELLHDVSRFSLRYFGQRDDGTELEWSSDWSNPTRLPRLVEFDLEFHDTAVDEWPPFVVTTTRGDSAQ